MLLYEQGEAMKFLHSIAIFFLTSYDKNVRKATFNT